MRQLWRSYFGPGLATLGLLVWSGCDYLAPSCGRECGRHDHHVHDGKSGEQMGDTGEGHTHVGPNGGRLIVLGDEDYHAELVIDHERAEATVRLLDRTGRKPVRVDQDEITLNIRCQGRPLQIRLTAVEVNDSATVARSCFRGTSEALRSECAVAGRLSVVIKGKPYTGHVAHHQDDHKMIR